jgi:hypothetical protein
VWGPDQPHCRWALRFTLPNKNIRRGPAAGGAPSDFTNRQTANDIYVDGSTNALTLGTGTSGVVSRVLNDSTTLGQSLLTPFIEGASVANGGTSPAVAGGPASATTLIKSVTGIANGVATDVITVTVPNAAEGATIAVTLTASLGAGGAIGAFQESMTAYGQIVLARTAGVNAVATAGALTNAADAKVAGSDAAGTLAYAVSAIAGAVGAVNTFTITVTITRGAGASTNHSLIIDATLYNSQASGVTFA